MSYSINLSNGTKLTDIIDGSIDQSATDLTLIGKEVANYGVYINENFVRLLENFSNITEPTQPITGQLWYDTSENILKIYNGVSFVPTGNTIVSGTTPLTFSRGGMWINSSTRQLFFNDGAGTLLAGPAYTAAQGRSGFIVEDVIDTNKISRTIVKLYVGGDLLGIYSKAAFTPSTDIPGFTGSVIAGFNVTDASAYISNMNVTQARALVDSNGDTKFAENFMSSIDDTYASGIVSMLNPVPAKFGPGEELQFEVNTSLFQIKSNIVGQSIQITTRTGLNNYPAAIYVDGSANKVGIFTNSPTEELDVDGNARIRGNLIVEGSTTTINTTNMAVEDLLIEIGKVASPSNTTANGGGISLQAGGDGDKTFTWSSLANAWVSSEHFNIANGKKYYIGGFEVLSSTALGPSIASAPGLTSVGHLTSLATGWLSFNNSTISYTSGFGNPTDGDIVLVPGSGGSIDVSNTTVINVATPVFDTDASNKAYVDTSVRSAPLAVYLDATGVTDFEIGVTWLAAIYPPSEHVESTICRVVCNQSGTQKVKEFYLLSGVWTFSRNII